MVGAALTTATVSLGRSMLAHQWLLARAAAVEKHCTYSILYLNLAAAAQMVCFKISRTFFVSNRHYFNSSNMHAYGGTPSTRTGIGDNAASLFLALQFAHFFLSFFA
jgi:hypothetical protein